MVVEQAVVEQRLHVAVEQTIDSAVTLAIEGREKEDEQAEDNRTNGKAHPGIGNAGKHRFHHLNGLVEVERHKAAEEAQHYHKRDARREERLALREEKLHVIAREGIGHCGACHRCDNQRHHRARVEVDEQHLDSEQHSRDRGLEDAGDTGCRATTHKEHERLWRQSEELPQVRPNRRTGKHYRTLGTHRATKAYCHRRRHERGIHVVRLQPALALCNGIEHTSDTVIDVVFNDISHIHPCQQDTRHREHQILIVATSNVHMLGEKASNKGDEEL